MAGSASLATLSEAFGAAPETIRYNGYARRIILEVLNEGPSDLRARAADLAAKIDLYV